MISSCSNKARLQELVQSSSDLSIHTRHEGELSVIVMGGDKSYVSSEVFEDALIKSLNDSKLFTLATKKSLTNDYTLLVIILSAYHNGWGNNNDISTKWIFKDKNGKEIWSRNLKAKGHSKSITGARFQESAENAAKSAIIKGMVELEALKL